MDALASDAELMTRFARAGDRAALATLVERWDRRILSFLVKAAGNREVGLDLRQEVFLRLCRYGRTYDGRGNFSTWLFSIAANVLRTWLARQGRRYGSEVVSDPEVEAHDAPDPAPSPRELAHRGQLHERLRGLLAELSVDDRQLLLLRLEGGLTYREIGDILGRPETTVKSHSHALLARLAESCRPLEIWSARREGK